MSSPLALHGGSPAIPSNFPRFNHIGKEEISAVTKVMETGVLSQFVGSWSADFYGGPQVQSFEKEWCTHFKTGFGVSVNSNTSGLICAVGAVGVEPGDEVIVSPWTMCASATAILVWNAIPVFADIEAETYNMDPSCLERLITPRTKAVMVTDIFGHPAALDEIMAIARKHNLKVIEDCAQAPGALYRGKYAGTVADIGVFSLNYHKHIHTGEGGICVTDNPELAERMQLIRNHAEAVVGPKGVQNLSNMIGFNFRMGEIEAAIAREQLKKLPGLVASRQVASRRLSEGVKSLPGLKCHVVKENCTHAYYVLPFFYDAKTTGVSRQKIVAALEAEGVGMGGGYVNVHRLPIYEKKTAYGTKGFPWTADFYRGDVKYGAGTCPVAESLHDTHYMGMGMCDHEYTDEQVDLVISAFRKVWSNLDYLRD